MPREKIIRLTAIDKAIKNEVTTYVLSRLQGVRVVEQLSADDAHAPVTEIVCVSWVPGDTFVYSIRAAMERRRPCCIFCTSQDRYVWEELRRLHEQAPFRLVVSIAGARERLRIEFPNARTIDVFALQESGKDVAGLLERSALT